MLRILRPRGAGRRIALGVLLSLSILATGIVIYAWQFSPDTDDQATHPRRVIPNTDVNPYGANFFLTQEVEEWKIRKTLQMAREAGIAWAKQQFPWEELQPRKPRAGEEKVYSWDKSDRLVALFLEYGLEVIARLDRPPDWTKTAGQGFQGPPDDYNDYGDFVYAFVKRYQGKIHYIQVWNEPNLWYEWGNRPPSPAEYASLLRVAYQRAKEADPNIYVLSAPLALTTERSQRAMPETEFLDQMYRSGAKDYFDILSANAFGFGWPPEDPPSADKLNFSRVLLQREVMVRHGDADKAVWFNEFGWNASPEGYSNEWYVWQRVTEANQAEYTVRAVQKARSEWNWVGVANIWYFRQVGTIPPDRSEYYFRVVDVDFTPRLVYHAIKEATGNSGVATAGYFEESHPAVSVASGWQMVRDSRASGGAYLTPAASGATISFAFRGDRLEVILARDSEGGQWQISIDGRPADNLPADRDGKTFLDLNSPAPRWQDHVLVAASLLQGPHTAQITAPPAATAPTQVPLPYPVKVPTLTAPSSDQSRRGGIDAFVVSGGTRDPRPYLTMTGILLVLAALAAVLLLVESRRGKASTPPTVR